MNRARAVQTEFRDDENFAHEQDRADGLASFRERFHIPPSPAHDDGRPSIYFCGNSLGCMPRSVRPAMERFLDDWARLGVEGHFEAHEAWYPYHEFVRDDAARLVGALPHEVVVMNSLTVNLHLMLTTFYRPEGKRRKILIDGPCFPSDVYAVKSQIRERGLDPDECLMWVTPRDGEHTIRDEDIIDLIQREGDTISVVLLSGLNFFSGQLYDMAAITEAARSKGCIVGWDCAHGVGNVPLDLHGIGADFAVWCHYKYCNSGPGAVGGCFVHERWTREIGFEEYVRMPRLEGWWGNDPGERFRMTPEFVPVRSADAWQLSNPPIAAMIPVRESLRIFSEAGLDRLREKSVRLTGYLEHLITDVGSDDFEIVTPGEPERRGCQLSILAHSEPGALFKGLTSRGVICDFREPNVIRVAPTPLFNTFHDCWRFAQVLREHVGATAR